MMPRWLLRFVGHCVTLLSLLLCLAAAALWVRGEYVGDAVESIHMERQGDVFSRRVLILTAGEGGLACQYFSASEEMPRNASVIWNSRHDPDSTQWVTKRPPQHPLVGGLMLDPWTPPKAGPTTVWNRLGFYGHFSRGPAPPRPGAMLVRDLYTNAHVLLPLWFATGLTALLPAWRLLSHWRRERFILAGHCPACGYDARATPRVCPECGRDPTATPPRLVLHSRALATFLRGAAVTSAAACGCLLALCLYATLVPLVAPMQPGAAVQLFNLDTYLPALPPVSLATLILLTALPPAMRLAASARSPRAARVTDADPDDARGHFRPLRGGPGRRLATGVK